HRGPLSAPARPCRPTGRRSADLGRDRRATRDSSSRPTGRRLAHAEGFMDNRKLIIIGCIVAGVVVILAVVAVRNRSDTSKPAPRPPEVVGQPVPAAVFEIDFAKRYDLHCAPA